MPVRGLPPIPPGATAYSAFDPRAHYHSDPREHTDPADKRLTKLWTAQAAFDLTEKVLNVIGSQLPQFTHSINVMVAGGPEADIRRVWYLALSAAFGRYRNRVRGQLQSGQIQGIWDVTGKACSVEIVYTTNRFEEAFDDSPPIGFGIAAGIGTTVALTPLIGPFAPVAGLVVGAVTYLTGRELGRVFRPPSGPADPTRSAQDVFRRGPEQLTIGGNWNDMLRANHIGTNTDGFQNILARITGFFSGSAAESNFLVTPSCATNGLKAVLPLSSYRPPDVYREYPYTQTRGNAQALAVQYPYSIVVSRSADGYPYVDTGRAAGAAVGTAGGAFNLPDHGRVITTAEKRDVLVQNPMPPVDGSTRCGVLALVAQSLQTPCYLPASPPCTSTPAAANGRYAFPPGSGDDFDYVSNRVAAMRNTQAGVVAPKADSLGRSLDGYPAPLEYNIPNFENR